MAYRIYAMRGDYRIYRGRGDPGISLKGILRGAGKVLGGAARLGSSLLPGPVGALARGAVGLISGGGATPAPPVLGAFPSRSMGAPGTAVAGRYSPLGTPGVCGPGMRLKKDGGCTNRKRPTMNPGNAKAARRAITRISSARRLLRTIEQALPKSRLKVAPGKKCGCR